MPLFKGKSKKDSDSNEEKSPKKGMAIAYKMAKKKKMAVGGMATEPSSEIAGSALASEPNSAMDSATDLAIAADSGEDITCPHCTKSFSHGGEVANENGVKAGEMPNEFDYLALEDGLESSYDGENSGDEDGDPDPDKKKSDLVSRAMLKRKAKKRD